MNVIVRGDGAVDGVAKGFQIESLRAFARGFHQKSLAQAIIRLRLLHQQRDQRLFALAPQISFDVFDRGFRLSLHTFVQLLWN